jgi:uncharacterized membrane protein YcaP (DUF421 family)
MELFFETLGRAAVIVVLVVVLTRLNGLRSFSKISSFDFAITVATGSVIATSLVSGDQFASALAAMVALFLVQGTISRLRRRFGPLRGAVDNAPLLLMEEGRILEENLRSANISRYDLIAKLREANAHDWRKVRAVVLETTGTISVIYADPDAALPEDLMAQVRREP